MTTTARDIGTLIVVVLKARNLPNKRQFGKQDPYCVVVLNGETRKTKVIKRGGQHPEWDEEIRFTIYEDSEALRGSNDGTPPPLPPKAGRGPKKIQGGEKMTLACFAADKEPEFIGETTVDLTEALTKGETDEWFTLLNKDKYSGEVYLELTFWSNEPRPEKKATPKLAMVNKQYGGPGVFIPSEEAPGHFQQRSGSFQDRSRRDSVPSLLSSNSSMGLDLYKPDYEQTVRARAPRGASMEQLVNDMGELMVSDPRRRDTFPVRNHPSVSPMQSGFSARSVSTSGHSVASSTSSQVFPVSESNAPDASTSSYVHRAITPAGHRPHRYSLSSSQSHEIPQYQPPYEQTLSSSKSSYHPPSRHGPRYSMPVASSGFIPVSSTFDSTLHTAHALTSYGSEPSGLAPLSANATLTLPGYVPRPPHTPAPTSYSAPPVSPAPTFSTTSVSAGSFLSTSLPQQPQALYGAQARYSPPAPAPPASHLPTPPLSTPTPPQLHAGLTQPVASQPQEYISPSNHVGHISPSRVVSNHVPGSRPLPPQPQHVPQRPPAPASTYSHAIGPPMPYGQSQVPLTPDVGLPLAQQNPLPIPPGPPGPLGPGSHTVPNSVNTVLPTGPSYRHTPSPSPQPSPSHHSPISRISNGTGGPMPPSSVPPLPGHPRSVSGRPSLPVPPPPPLPSAMVSYHQQSFPQLPVPPLAATRLATPATVLNSFDVFCNARRTGVLPRTPSTSTRSHR
ncbi:hypothetical protein BJY52DRAFT_1111136 [Lactarius psammicola]|nr:hypothetical protein BJY52DRAFT_1111136 [Lactarius psammicola]